MNLDEAVVALQVHARQIEAVQVIADAIKQASDLEQLRAEREAALGPISKHVEEAEAAAVKRMADLRAQIGEQEKRLSDAKSRMAQAETDASKRADANSARAEASLNDLNKKAKALESQLAALEEKVKARTANLTEINAALDMARKTLSAT